MTTYATDTTLTGGRGSPNAISPGSDGFNWNLQRGNQTPSFSGTQLVFTYNGSTTLGVWTYSSLSESVIEVLVNVTPNSTSDIIGAVLCQSGTSYYYADIGNIAGKFEIGVAPAFTSLASATFAFSAGTKYTIRMQYGVVSNTLRAKIWQTSGSEPGAWTVSIVDNTLSVGGGFGICMAPVGGGTTVFDTFSATDGNTGPVVTNYAFTDSLSVADTLLGGVGYIPTDGLTVTDTFRGAGGYTATDGLAAFDSLLGGNGYNVVEGLSASDSMGGSGGFSSIDGLSITDSLSVSSAYSPIESIPVSSAFTAGMQAAFIDALTASDLMVASTGFQATDALSAADQLTATSLAQFAESLAATSKLSGTVILQIVETLVATDAFSAQEVTPTPPVAALPTTLVFASFRSGSVQATYRNGQQLATYRDGVATVGGR